MSTQDTETKRIVDHAVRAIDAAAEHREPFYHLQFADIFPPDVYAAMLDAMPARDDYRQMSGRTKYTRTDDGGGTRTKLDLFPELVRHLPAAKKKTWDAVGRALRSPEVREAFRRKLAPGLAKRFGERYRTVPMFPIPILTRDVAGYRVGIHADARRKGITVQLYLPRDRSIEHVGTVFHRRAEGRGYERALQMAFAPNTGYAFAVGDDTHHSVDVVPPEVRTRDSILLTYFLDDTPARVISNRAKRLGNFVLNEIRSLAR